MKRHIILLLACFIVVTLISGIYFYQHPSVNSKLLVDCNYFRRVADVHWAEAKVYDDLAHDAIDKRDFTESDNLDQKHFQKQTLAQNWENLYQDCKTAK